LAAFTTWDQQYHPDFEQYRMQWQEHIASLELFYQKFPGLPHEEAFYKELIRFSPFDSGKDSAIGLETRAHGFNELAILSELRDNHSAAIRYFDTCIWIYDKISGIIPDFDKKIAIVLANQGIAFENNKDYPSAERLFNRSLDIYRKMPQTDSPAYRIQFTNILSRLSATFEKEGKQQNAKNASLKLLIISMSYKEDDNQHYSKLAEVSLRRIIHLTEPQLSNSVTDTITRTVMNAISAEVQKDSSSEQLLFILICNYLAAHHLENQELPQAKKTLATALDLLRHIGNLGLETYTKCSISTFSNLGVLYHYLGDNVRTEYYFKKAVGIVDSMEMKNPGLCNDLLANCYSNLGKYYYSVDKNADAATYLARSSDFYRILAATDPNNNISRLLEILSLLDTTWNKLKNHAAQEKVLKEEISIIEENGNLQDKEDLALLSQLYLRAGALYQDRSDSARGESFLKKAFHNFYLLARLYGDPYKDEMGKTLLALGDFYLAHYNADSALIFYQQARQFYFTADSEQLHRIGLIRSLLLLGDLYRNKMTALNHETSDSDSSRIFFDEAVAAAANVSNSALKEAGIDIAGVLLILGTMDMQQHHPDKAKKEMRQALILLRKSPPLNRERINKTIAALKQLGSTE
jgi:Tfp pilus assembly protein PilF